MSQDISFDQEQIADAFSRIIEAIGEQPTRDGLRDTPRRVAAMYSEFFSGLQEDPAAELLTGFNEDHHELVILRDIEFFSICEHHFLPFFGKAHVGYIPNGRIVGASKLVRAFNILARRPQVQERLTRQYAETLFGQLKPSGVGVIVEAEHLCMSVRGVKQAHTKIVTTCNRGNLKISSSINAESVLFVETT